jgi:pantoate--beta-alanine ligase
MVSTVTTIQELRTAILPWREVGETVALVPTMGALHHGHMSLIAQARKMAKRVVVSVFVNPAQFAPNEDLARYPRPVENDMRLLTESGCDLIYMPDALQIYPEGFKTTIDPGPMAKILEGAFRPHFFYGVATVVVKLLLQILPDGALFGEKDYQQLQIVRQVVRDLNIPIHIIGVPIVRDADGLAFSSRNVYLSPNDRNHALALPRSLQEASAAIRTGGDIEYELTQGAAKMAAAGFSVDYFELAHAVTLSPLRDLNSPARLLAAGHIGSTRLIDNIAV